MDALDVRATSRLAVVTAVNFSRRRRTNSKRPPIGTTFADANARNLEENILSC